MIIRKKIEADLVRLNILYTESMAGADPRVPVYFSKLGVLELTGWVEESFDLIAQRAVKKRIRGQKFDKLLKGAINRNHGFSYDDNFIDMMVRVVGLPECEQLEAYLDSSVDILRSELAAVLDQRRKAAHVHLASTTITFDSPSVSLGRLGKIYPIVKKAYCWFCR